jgi:NADH-quinone oxidoreductase subunit A
MELKQYVPVLMLIILALVTVIGMLVGSVLLGKVGKRNKAKDTPYECGIEPITPGTSRYPVKFYQVALIFILFDVEVVFFYPWAVAYKELLKNPGTHNLVLFSMAAFTLILIVAYYYAVKKGVLNFK